MGWFFQSRVNREAGASEDVKAALQPFGRCKLTPWKMDSAVLRDRCTELPVLIRLFQLSFSSSFSPFFCGQSQCGVSPCCNELLLLAVWCWQLSSAMLSILSHKELCLLPAWLSPRDRHVTRAPEDDGQQVEEPGRGCELSPSWTTPRNKILPPLFALQ